MDKKCVKCDAVLTRCDVTGGRGMAAFFNFKAYKYKNPEKVFKKMTGSVLHPYVCPSCGYTEWYADEPENFA